MSETISEVIQWHHVDDGLPDDDAVVLICGPSWEPTEAWCDDGRWLWDSGRPVNSAITHWAEMPKGPTDDN